MKELEEMLEELERSIVATPETRQELEEFYEAADGDYLALQMAIQFGYKIAIERLQNSYKQNTTQAG